MKQYANTPGTVHFLSTQSLLAMRILLIGLTIAGCATLAFTQGIVTGSISGTVQDPQGAVVPEAKVTATHLATNRQFTTQSNNVGTVSLRDLPTGLYEIRVEAPSFRPFVSKGVQVAAGNDTSLGRIQLTLGSSNETVMVEGTTPLVESTSDQISATFDSKEVQSLPMGNTFDSLALFVPGVATAGDASFSNNNGAELSVNGERARANNFQIDGQSNNDNSIAGPSIFFGNQDAISEIQVVTNYDAQFGRNSGAVVNYLTKAGTNVFHGTAYEFWQGSTFDSLENQEKNPLLGFCTPGQNPTTTGCIQPTVPRFVDNRFGGTVGGPVKKDKIWFFASTNLERQRTGGAPSSSAPGLVPTPTGVQQLEAAFPSSPIGLIQSTIGPNAVKAGNPVFNNIQDVLVTNQINPKTGAAFPCTIAGVNGCTPIQFGSITRFVAGPFDNYEGTGRMDFKLSSKDNFFARYVVQKQSSQGVNFGNGIDVGDWQTVPSLSQQIGLDWVRTFSNTTVNQVRASYSRANVFFQEASFPTCVSSTPTACPADMIMVGSAPQDSVSFGVAAGFPEGRIINVYQLQDNASKLIGRHTLKFGGEAAQQRSPNVFLPFNNGGFIFNSFSDMVANNPATTLIALGSPQLPFKEWDVGTYFQDDWRVKDNLTLNLGVRWDWYQQAINLLHDRSVTQQTGPDPLWSKALPLSQTTVPSVPQKLHNFAPVVGFAWTPRMWKKVTGEDNTVIRGGFRLVYDPAFYNMFLNVGNSAPSVNFSTLSGTGLPSTGFFGTQVIPYLEPLAPRGNPGLATQTQVSDNFRNPYSEQWNLGVQRTLINNKVVAEVRYVGNHAVAQFQQLNTNPALGPLIAAGFANVIPAGLRPCTTAGAPGAANGIGYANCNFTNVTQFANTAWAKYDGLQSELRIAGWHGLSATASYTYSHAMDNVSEVYGSISPAASSFGGNTLASAQNPFDTNRAERGNSGTDFPNVFGLALVYDLPFYRTQSGFLGHLLGGWQFNNTYRYTSGQPYTVVQNYVEGSLCDPTASWGGTYDACRPILANTSAPMASVGQFTCAGATAATCTLANFVTGAPTSLSAVHWVLNDPNAAIFYGTPFAGVGRNTLRGEPISTTNLAFFKNTRVTERLTAQFQFQVFNVMNTMFRGVPSPILQDAASITDGVPKFGSVQYNLSAGGTFAGNVITDGIGRRRLLFGLKLIF